MSGYVSAQDVARLAGVSRSAVSRCFTDGASVAPQTRARIIAAAETLGYHVNDLARGLINRSSRLVGLIVTNPTGFRAHLLFALSRQLIERGSVPVIVNTGTEPREQAAARDILIGYRAEASIVLSGTPPQDFVDLARQNGQPVILIGRDEAGFDTVQVENSAPARRTARLFHAAGYQRLAVVTTHAPTPMIARRARAFADAAADLGASVQALHATASVYEGGQEVARTLDAEAVFCTNDLLALGLIDGLRRAGRPLPAVVGFDDLPEAAWSAYDLTTFRQDPEATAKAALHLLERRQRQPQAPAARVVIPPAMVSRGSFCPATLSGADAAPR